MTWTPRSVPRMSEYDKSKHPLWDIIEAAVVKVPAVRRSHTFRAHAYIVAHDVADAVIEALHPNLPLCDVIEDADKLLGILLEPDARPTLAVRFGAHWMEKAVALRENLKAVVFSGPAITQDMVEAGARALAKHHGFVWDRGGYHYEGSGPPGYAAPDAWEDEARSTLEAALTQRFDRSKRRDLKR